MRKRRSSTCAGFRRSLFGKRGPESWSCRQGRGGSIALGPRGTMRRDVTASCDGMRKELFYVAASRGQESITVVTTDKDLLRESVAHSVVRQSASELSRKAREPSLERLK